jgi:hypothetical protein
LDFPSSWFDDAHAVSAPNNSMVDDVSSNDYDPPGENSELMFADDAEADDFHTSWIDDAHAAPPPTTRWWMASLRTTNVR